jgi:hypothetical protein
MNPKNTRGVGLILSGGVQDFLAASTDVNLGAEFQEALSGSFAESDMDSLVSLAEGSGVSLVIAVVVSALLTWCAVTGVEIPLDAARKLQCAVHAQPLLSAAVAYPLSFGMKNRYVILVALSGLAWFLVAGVLGSAVPVLGSMWFQHSICAILTAFVVGFIFNVSFPGMIWNASNRRSESIG